MGQSLGVAGDDPQIAALQGVDDRGLRRGDRDLHGAGPQRIRNLLGIVEDFDLDIEALAAKVARLHAEPQRNVEDGPRYDGHPNRDRSGTSRGRLRQRATGDATRDNQSDDEPKPACHDYSSKRSPVPTTMFNG